MAAQNDSPALVWRGLGNPPREIVEHAHPAQADDRRRVLAGRAGRTCLAPGDNIKSFSLPPVLFCIMHWTLKQENSPAAWRTNTIDC